MSLSLITTSLLTTIDGDTERIEEQFRGVVKRRGEQVLLTYEEPDNGGQTRVKIASHAVWIQRQGETRSTLRFVLGAQEPASYLTPVGRLEMKTQTHEIAWETTEAGGQLRIAYTLSLFGQPTSENVLTLQWKL